MSDTVPMPAGGYAYMPGVFQYSCGVGALPGFEIRRVTFDTPVPLEAGFAWIKAFLEAAGRPLEAFCACELRSPGQFSEDGFRAFNELYCGTLEAWGIYEDGINPVARSNVCPEIGAPATPSFHAFSYTVPSDAGPTFVIAGSGEVPEGKNNYFDHVVARGDQSPEGMRAKARHVLGEMERRMASFGKSWADVTAAQIYTVFPIHSFLAEELVTRGTARHGATWYFARPPIVELDYEMDTRRVLSETVVSV
ncbi:hypothetical protein [Acuticoccus sp. I52.16.1]|uniref:2-amino-5-chloromuconate deaminase CnbZ n=1 Tax=Acuticoccus sp. I52.16.1 TaxID=2928472 RepID=UPI001FD457C0|nr:hypothetical protein [Acuticoccus sp. I52.16.1]UOM35763.1 hypothetical protein MRB58_06045 [Acuticoccus sp. I52.16.1]